MKQHHYILFTVLLLLFGLLTVGTANGLTPKQQSNADILRQVVLRKTDFPEDVEDYTFSSDEAKAEDFNEQISFVTIPFWAEGFVDAYRVNGWYTLTFEEEALKEFSPGAFVENIAYVFESQEQAANAFEQQLTQFNTDVENLETKIEDIQHNSPQSKLIRVDYTQEGMDFTLYVFIGVVDNRLLFLMVDGVPDPTVQRAFENLVTKLVSYQSEN